MPVDVDKPLDQQVEIDESGALKEYDSNGVAELAPEPVVTFKTWIVIAVSGESNGASGCILIYITDTITGLWIVLCTFHSVGSRSILTFGQVPVPTMAAVGPSKPIASN